MESNEKNVVYNFKIGDAEVKFVEQEATEQSFMNNTVFNLDVFGMNVGITETIYNTWIIMGIMILLALVVRIKLKSFKEIPNGVQNFVELLVETFANFTKSIMGEHNKNFAGFYMSMFLFILICNLSGLFALRPPTADVATTFALSITTFLMIQGNGIATKGIKRYIKGFFEPIAAFFPINLIGEIATPISLGFRLFGNILGGTIIMTLVYSIPFIPFIGIPAVLHIYFDVFAGVLQSFIFVMLSMTFVSNAIEYHEEEATEIAK